MVEDPPRPPRWKRRIKRILVALVLTPLVLLALGNLLLATPWVRGALAKKLTTRTGLDAAIGRASFTPWGGFHLGAIRLEQPQPVQAALKQPLLEIAGLKVFPRWDRLLVGKLDLDRISIDRPKLVISLEMAASLASSGTAQAIATPPPVASVPEASASPKPVEAKPLPPAAAVAASPPTPDAVRGTAWIELKYASVDFYLSGARLASLQGASGRIPVAGVPATSSLGVGEIGLLGRSIGRDLTIPLSWRAPELRCEGGEFRLADLQVKVSAALGLMRGLPFAMESTMPLQPARGDSFFKTLRPAADGVEGKFQGRGLLRFPMTWEGAAATVARQATMNLAGQEVAFDEARTALVLRQGELKCPEFRMTGDRMSFLGNGSLRTDGEVSGVLRIVVPPDVAAPWSRRLTVEGRAPVFAPLETPDRVFIDLRWLSYPGGQGIELGAGGPVIPVSEFARLLNGVP